MTESEQRLRALLRIRNIRVKKQMAILRAAENVLNQKISEQIDLNKNLDKTRQAYQKKQQEQTEKLLNNRSGILDFLLLKDSEEHFFWKSKNMARQGDALVNQILQSKEDCQIERNKFKTLEKAVVKVEEFLKLDWK